MPIVRLLALILCAAAISACGGATASPPTPTATPEPPPPISVGPNETIVVGISVALSGDQMNLGADMADAAAMAAAERTIAGRRVEVVRVDDGCTDAEQSVAAARELLERETLVGVVGPMCTTGVQAAGKVLRDAQVVHISASATRDDLSEAQDGFFFRTAWRDEFQAATQAEYAANDLRAKTAIVIDDGDPYGKGLADAFAAEFTALGGTVLSRERIVRGSTDFPSLAQRIVAAGPDAVVFEGLNPEGALLVQALRDEEYAGDFMAPDGVLSVRDFIGIAGTDADGAILTGGPYPDAGFIGLFQAMYGREPTTPFVLQAFDAMDSLLKAVEATATEQDGRLVIDRVALSMALRDGSYEGFTGRIDFNERGDRIGETAREFGLTIYRVEASQFVVVE